MDSDLVLCIFGEIISRGGLYIALYALSKKKKYFIRSLISFLVFFIIHLSVLYFEFLHLQKKAKELNIVKNYNHLPGFCVYS